MRVVHVVGNSHVMYFVGREVPSDETLAWNDDSISIRTFKAGNTGATIYGLDKKESETGAGPKIAKFVRDEKPQDLVIVLGDVDFREHMMRHLPHGVASVPEYLEGLMLLYGDYIDRELRPHVSGEIVLFEMVPFTKSFFMHKVRENVQYGALYFLHEDFNRAIRKLAADRRYKTMTVANGFVDAAGFLRADLATSDVEVHINPKIAMPHVVSELENVLGQS